MVQMIRQQRCANPCGHLSELDIVVDIVEGIVADTVVVVVGHVGVHAFVDLDSQMQIGLLSRNGRYSEVAVVEGGSPNNRRAATCGRSCIGS